MEPRRAAADHGQRRTSRAGHRDIPAFDDGGLLARDGRHRVAEPILVVQVDVGDDRHATIPGMGRIEPAAQADLDQGDIERLFGEPAKDDGREQFEFGRVAESARDPVRGHQDLADEAGERVAA